MDRRTLMIAAGLVALGLLTALYVLRDTADGFTMAVISVIFAADLMGVYFIMQFGLSHDGLPHVDTADNSVAVQRLRQMNSERMAKVEAGRARGILTAGTEAPAVVADAPKPKRASRRGAAPAGESDTPATAE